MVKIKFKMRGFADEASDIWTLTKQDMNDAANADNATSTCEERWSWNPTGSVLQIIGYCLVVIPVLAVILNIAEVVLVIKAPKLKPHSRIFLVSLAFCDILIGLTVMPLRILGMVTNSLPVFGQVGCDIGGGLEVLLLTASVWHMCVLAFDRYISLCRPFFVHFWFGRRNGALIFATCWFVPTVLAFGLVTPKFHILTLEKQYKCFYEEATSCQHVTNTYYSVLHAVFAILVPSSVIAICNRQTLIAMLRRQRIMTKLTCINTERGSFHRRFIGTSFSRTILTMTTVSFIFWLPFFTMFSVDPFISFRIPRYFWTVFAWLCYVHSVINPVLYMRGTKPFKFRSFLMS